MDNQKNKVGLMERKCTHCKESRSGECLGLGNPQICQYYKEVPSYNEEIRNNWPKGMSGGGDYEPWYYR